MVSLLRRRNFALLSIGQLISILGDQLLALALPFYIYAQTQSSLATGLMVVIQTAPGLILSSLAGVWVDRWNRRMVMLLTDLMRAALLIFLLFFHTPDFLWAIYTITFFQSCFSQFFNPAKSASIPNLVGKDQILQANSLIQVSNTLTTLIGPALGGLLLGLYGIEPLILLDIGSYLFSAAMIFLIRLPVKASVAMEMEAEKASPRFWQEWLSGFSLVRQNRLIKLIFIIIGLSFFAEGMVAAMIVPYVKTVLKGDAQVMGWCATAQSVGALIGGLVVGQYGKHFRPRLLLSICLFFISLTYFLIAIFPSLPLVLSLLLLFGVPTITALVTLQSLLQQNVDGQLQGRIFGNFGSLISMSLLFGACIGAVLGNFTGPVLVLEVVAGLHLTTTIIIVRFGSIFQPVNLSNPTLAPPD